MFEDAEQDGEDLEGVALGLAHPDQGRREVRAILISAALPYRRFVFAQAHLRGVLALGLIVLVIADPIGIISPTGRSSSGHRAPPLTGPVRTHYTISGSKRKSFWSGVKAGLIST